MTRSAVLTMPEKRSLLKTLWEKGENAGNQHFLLFPQCFLPITKKGFRFQVTFNLLSAKAFDLGKPKNLSYGKKLFKCCWNDDFCLS